jgi:hypothetical protein
MHFAYEGFTQDGIRRRFRFRAVEASALPDAFAISVDLPLLVQNRVSVQDGPAFCLELLTRAKDGGISLLEGLQSYQVVDEDFRPLLVQREKLKAEKALRGPGRRPYRKPSSSSNLHMGKPAI